MVNHCNQNTTAIKTPDSGDTARSYFRGTTVMELAKDFPVCKMCQLAQWLEQALNCLGFGLEIRIVIFTHSQFQKFWYKRVQQAWTTQDPAPGMEFLQFLGCGVATQQK